MQIEEIVAEIRAHHRRARLMMKASNAIKQRLSSYVVFDALGYTPGDKAALKKGYAEAGKVIKAALADKDHELHNICAAIISGCEPLDAERSAREKAMVKLVKQLPVHQWALAIKGFGDLGLAQIIAEAGDLGKYGTVSKLWKRLGLAVMNGNRQGAPGKGASAEDWIEHGYSPERRAIIWSIFSDSMFRHQWAAAAEGEDVGKPKGPYGEVYARRRAHTAITHPDWTKGHSHNDARRVMTKSVIADLWSAWRETRGYAKPTPPLSPVPNSAEADMRQASLEPSPVHRVPDAPLSSQEEGGRQNLAANPMRYATAKSSVRKTARRAKKGLKPKSGMPDATSSPQGEPPEARTSLNPIKFAPQAESSSPEEGRKTKSDLKPRDRVSSAQSISPEQGP